MRGGFGRVQLPISVEEAHIPVRSKYIYMAGLLVFSLTLVGCGGSLKLPAQGRTGFPTATPGIESKGVGEAPSVGSTEAVVAEAPTSPPPVVTEAPSAPPPTEVPPPDVAPTINPVLENVQLPTGADLESRWRDLQVDRTPFEAPRTFVSPSYQIVWWFDPIYGQFVPLGEIHGDFPVQATFRIKGQWVVALEVPYHINQDYDFKLPDPILKRMQAAGSGEWREVFVYQTRDIQPK